MKVPQINIGDTWPPAEDKKRLQAYEAYRRLLDWESFDLLTVPTREIKKGGKTQFKVLPTPKLVCLSAADLLFGNAPDILKSEDNEAGSEAAVRMADDNELWLTCHEAETTCAALGDIFFQIRVSEVPTEKGVVPRVIIEAADPSFGFAEYTGQYLTRGMLAWTHTTEDRKSVV